MSSVPLASLLPKPTKIIESPGTTNQRNPKSTALVDFSPKLPTAPKARVSANTMQMSTVPIEYDGRGLVNYEALAKVGHDSERIVQAGYADSLPKDLIRGESGIVIKFNKPPQEEIDRQMEATKRTLEALIGARISATQPKSVTKPEEAKYIKYKPETENGQTRVLKIVDLPVDPLEPPKFRHKRIPRPPASPPAPVLHSPPRKATHAEQQAWKIPPCISNWKNPNGYTIPLDKRLASDGRGLQEAVANERFAGYAEALYLAEKHAKEEVEQRSKVGAQIDDQKRETRDAHIRELASKAREEHPRHKEMTSRDVSEPYKLGKAHTRVTGEEHLYDTRLFDKSSGMTSGFADDESYDLYDKPLFKTGAAAIDAIYRPSNERMDSEAHGQGQRIDYKYVQPTKAFSGTKTDGAFKEGTIEFDAPVPLSKSEVLHRTQEGSNQEDPFGINEFISSSRKRATEKASVESSKEDEYKRSRR